MPGIAPSRPLTFHGDAGHGKDPFITLPPLRGARLSHGGLSDNSPQRAGAAQGSGLAAGSGPRPAASDSGADNAQGAARAPLPENGPSGSIALVLQRRLEQVAKGYTAERNMQLPIGFLANEAGNYLGDARDWLLRKGQDPNRRHYEGKLVNAAALLLAELDRLHAKRAAEAAQSA